MSPIETLIVGDLFAFLLIFTRVGTAFMIMPGIGDSFVAAEIRLLFSVAVSFVMTPVLKPLLPALPASAVAFAALIIMELIVGLFIGTVMRIMIGAMDTAGMMISMQSGFSNAQMFNAVTGSQGSMMGALYSTMAVTLMMVTNLHHLLITSVFESYQIFPADGRALDFSEMSNVIASTVNIAFKIGIQLSAPFLVIGLITYAGFGVLGRLMPQLQVFFLAMPVQIFLSLVTLSLVFSAGMMYWLTMMEDITINVFAR